MRLDATIDLLALVAFLVTGSQPADAVPLQRDAPSVCGYASCPKSDPNKLNIHLVPHSHDDVGWLKTVQQYYYGVNNLIQEACVECIIDSVVDALLQDPSRRFIYVEMAFLWKWLKRSNAKRVDIMKDLINQGRLEIIGGAWSMNDEAVTHYQSIIDQFTWGFRYRPRCDLVNFPLTLPNDLARAKFQHVREFKIQSMSSGFGWY